MRYAATGLIVMMAATLTVPGAAASPAVGPAAVAKGAPSRAGHSGRWITDRQGRVVLPVGVNLINKKAPYTPEAIGFDEEDARFLHEQGFTSVRLGILWKAVEPEPGVYDDAYLNSIRRTVDLLHSHGMSTLLDMHQDMVNEKFQGEGFPDWAVQTDGWPNIIKVGFQATSSSTSPCSMPTTTFTATHPVPAASGWPIGMPRCGHTLPRAFV